MDVSPSSTATAVTEDDPEREYLSEDSITERTDDQGTGYGFEPSMTSEQRLQRRQKRRKQLAFNSVLQRMIPRDRLQSTNGWCQCELCSITTLLKPKECYCCRELPANVDLRARFMDKLANFGCISLNPKFEKYCLDREHLEIVELVVAEKFGTSAKVDFGENSTYRHAAYVSYTYWIYGELGASIRKVLPACAVTRIRNEFPDPRGQYVGYRSASEYEDNASDDDSDI